MGINVVGCGKHLNPNELPHFDIDGNYTEKVATFTSKAPSEIKFYVEVSGSMNGFFRSNKPTQFKKDVWSVFSDFASITEGVNIFAKQGDSPIKIGLNDFRTKMNAGAFVSSASTDVPDMLKRILGDIDCSKSEVGMLVSDMKYDPVGNAAISVLLQQYTSDIRNMMANSHKALCLIVAKSEFLDKKGSVVCEESPYYYLIIGNPENVVWMRNFVCTLLNQDKHFVDYIEWGVDYKSPKIKIEDPDYLSVENAKALSGFDEDCDIVLNVDITDYPWMYENPDSLIKYLSIKSEEDLGVNKLTKKDISYDIKKDDGKQLKRTAFANIKLHLSDMYDTADVLNISLNTPEVIFPNNDFAMFLGAVTPNDVSRTYSMEQFLTGCYVSMERFRDKKAVHILISKN